MTSRTISAADAARAFAEIVDRVKDRGEVFVIEEDGQPVARLGPVAMPSSPGTVGDLVLLVEKLGRDPDFADRLDEIIAEDNQPLGPASR